MADPRDVTLAAEIMKASPPVIVTAAAKVFGLTLSDWIAVLTIVYLVLQIGLLLPKYRGIVAERLAAAGRWLKRLVGRR